MPESWWQTVRSEKIVQFLVTESEAIRHAITVIRMESSKVYIDNDSQIVINTVNEKITVPKDIYKSCGRY